MTFCRPVVLDACVPVGAGLRDTLLRLAEVPALYAPRWSLLPRFTLALAKTLGIKLG
ncbi:MAG: hypothetical protein ABSE57_01180 [Bryobacteraceae bacterium]|jgi:hypothetical protein